MTLEENIGANKQNITMQIAIKLTRSGKWNSFKIIITGEQKKYHTGRAYVTKQNRR